MDLINSKIGYVSYSPDLSQPGDRRRFPYFAKRMNIPFEIADPSKSYDVVLLTAPSNLTRWLRYKQEHPGTKFLFEMVDSLVFPDKLVINLFRGTGRYLLGKEDGLVLHHQRILDKWIRLADCVICSNEALCQFVKKTNPIAITSPDYLQSEYKLRKHNYEVNDKMKLVWEGLPSVLFHFLQFKDVLREVSSFCELHIISKPKYPRIPKIVNCDTEKLLTKLPIQTVFHEWDIRTHNQILADMDCGIIPIDRRNKFAWHKPSNKLVSFWFCGLPTLTSDTPAYSDLFRQTGFPSGCCTDAKDWVNALNAMYRQSPDEKRALAERNLNFAMENFSDAKLDEVWFQIFNHL